jgi:hypothetical protein
MRRFIKQVENATLFVDYNPKGLQLTAGFIYNYTEHRGETGQYYKPEYVITSKCKEAEDMFEAYKKDDLAFLFGKSGFKETVKPESAPEPIKIGWIEFEVKYPNNGDKVWFKLDTQKIAKGTIVSIHFNHQSKDRLYDIEHSKGMAFRVPLSDIFTSMQE